MRNGFGAKYFFMLLFSLLCFTTIVWAEHSDDDTVYVDKARLVSQQIDLLKTRLLHAKNELHTLQHQEEKISSLSLDHVNKSLLEQVGLDISVQKSNLDSINIELSEAQQTINRLEKDSAEIENQLNVFSVFGLKIITNAASNVNVLKYNLNYQKNLLQLEKDRATYLQKLRDLSDSELQLYKIKYSRIEVFLKSQTMLQLKKQQEKSESEFQQQQSYWLNHLTQLHTQLAQLASAKNFNKNLYAQVEHEVFYANEHVNFTYLQTLLARYQDQIQQLKVSISRSNSIVLLSKVGEQVQQLNKQLGRMQDLLNKRIDILEKRKSLLVPADNFQTDINNLNKLTAQYKLAIVSVAELTKELNAFRVTLDQALEQALSSRQGLPGFSAKAWLDLGQEILLVPPMTFQVMKSLIHNIKKGFSEIDLPWMTLLIILEILWISFFYYFRRFLANVIAKLAEYELGHVNLKRIGVQMVHRTLIDIGVIGNIAWLFSIIHIPSQNFTFIVNLGLVWLLFKAALIVARLCLVESVHDRAGQDVRLYHQLKWIFGIGGILTGLTVFLQQLPVIYELTDLFNRMFLLFLLLLSILWLKSWRVFPAMLVLHIDERSTTYLRGIVKVLGLLIPVILLINSAIGLFGFVNLVYTMGWYEGIFLVVLVGYLIIKGLVHDGMEWLSHVFIRHIHNGWLWTEAILKPLDRVIQILIFLSSWVVLFLWYGWDRQSPVVERITKLLHYRLVDVLNTTITPFSVLELCVIAALLYWVARWTREFVYRLLLSRTHDLGVRNTIAILTQYTLMTIGIFVGLRVLGIDFRALTFIATALAFGVGLGLRDLVNNFACGFLLLLERPLRVGDVVSINGMEGDVMHIGGRAVTIRTWDHMEVIVPNVEIFNKTFTNWTAKDNIVRSVITIKIDRHDRPMVVQKIIHEALDDHEQVLKDPIPEVFLVELRDGLIEFEVRYYLNLRQVKSRVGLRSEVLMKIWEHFDRHGIKPPYPHHELHLDNK